jgi:hypothetical protein
MSAARIPTTLLPEKDRERQSCYLLRRLARSHEKVLAYEAGEYPSVTRGSDRAASNSRLTSGRVRSQWERDRRLVLQKLVFALVLILGSFESQQWPRSGRVDRCNRDGKAL